MMNETTFWKIIEQSIQEKQSVDKNEQGDSLLKILEKYSNEDIVDFQIIMEKLRNDIGTVQMHRICDSMYYEDNATAFRHFRSWVISLGKQYYDKASQNPNTLLDIKDPNLFIVGAPNFNDLDFVGSASYKHPNNNPHQWDQELRKRKRMLELSKQKNKEKDLER